jgi:hypothetical protein
MPDLARVPGCTVRQPPTHARDLSDRADMCYSCNLYSNLFKKKIVTLSENIRIYIIIKLTQYHQMPQATNSISFVFIERASPTRSSIVGILYLGTVGHRIWIKNLDMIDSLQRHMTGVPSTSYQIKSHHSWPKKRGHQPKRTRPRNNPYHSSPNTIGR